MAGSSALAHGSGHASDPGRDTPVWKPGSDKPVWNTGDKVLYNGTSPKKQWVLVTVTSTEVVQGIRLYHVQGECEPKKVANWAAYEKELKDAPPPMAGSDQDAAAPEQEQQQRQQQQQQPRLCVKKGRWARGKQVAPPKLAKRGRPAACSPSRAGVRKDVWTPEKQNKYSSAASAAKCAYAREMKRSGGDKNMAAAKSRLRYGEWKKENPAKDSRRPVDKFISVRDRELKVANPGMTSIKAISLARKEWVEKNKKSWVDKKKEKDKKKGTDNKRRRWGRLDAGRPLISRTVKDMRKTHRLIGKQKGTAVPASGGAAAAHGTASSSFETPRKEPRTAAAALAQPQRAQGWVETSEANYPAARGAFAAEPAKNDDPRFQDMDRDALILLTQLSPASRGPPAAASGPASDEPAVPGSIAASDKAAAAHGTAARPGSEAFQALLDTLEF